MKTSKLAYENFVTIIGKVVSITKANERLGAAFYEIGVRVNRATAGKYDDVIVYAPEWARPEEFFIGKTVKLNGELRIYKNRRSLWQSKQMMVYTKKITIVDDNVPHINEVELIGDLHQFCESRKTPLTDRVITDFSILVYRTGGYCKGERFEIIHCIAWRDQTEEFQKILNDNGKVHVFGRIQQRAFEKKHSNGTVTNEFVHEISCRSVNKY